MPNVEVLELTFDLGSQPVTESTVYTWVPGSDPDAYITVWGLIDGEPTTSFACRTIDDGQFVLSDEVLQRIGQPFAARFGGMYRVRNEISIVDNVGVNMTSLSAAGYNF